MTLTVLEGAQPPDLQYGQKVEFQARVRRVRNLQNPGAFDYEGYAARSHIYWNASVRKDQPIRILEWYVRFEIPLRQSSHCA